MNEFKVHRLNKRGLEKADKIAAVYEDALAQLCQLLANDNKGTSAREHGLMVTKLQESCFFAKRAMALDPVNQSDAYEGT